MCKNHHCRNWEAYDTERCAMCELDYAAEWWQIASAVFAVFLVWHLFQISEWGGQTIHIWAIAVAGFITGLMGLGQFGRFQSCATTGMVVSSLTVIVLMGVAG